MPNYSTGDLSLWGYATESTPGTFVSPTAYIAVEPGQPLPKFNPARGTIDIAGGLPNVTANVVDRKGSGTWQIAMKIFPSTNLAFLTACGLTSGGLVAPSSLSLQVNDGAKSYEFAGCRANKIVLSSSIDNDFMATVSGFFTTRPVVTSALSAPSWSIEQPYIWTNLGAVTLLSGGTTNSDLESFSVQIDLVHAMGYGNAGVPLPNIVKLSRFMVSGQVQAYLNDSNYAEFSAMIANGGTGGSLSIPFTTTGHTATLAIANAKYTTGDMAMPAQGLDMITLPFQSYTSTLGNQLTWTTT